MTEIDWFGHWAYAFIFLGMYYVGCKDKVGWVFRFFGEAMWVGLGLCLGLSSVWFWGLFGIGLDIYNYRKWAREKPVSAKQFIADYVDENGFGALPESVINMSRDLTHFAVEDLRRFYEDEFSQSEGADVAKKRSVSRKKKVQPARGRRSVKADGVGRSRSDVKRKGSKGTRRNVRVQKDNRRANAKGSRTSKA